LKGKIFARLSARRRRTAERVFLPAAAGSGQLKISVGIFLKIGSDFNQNIPPVWSFRVFSLIRLAPASPGLGFLNEIPGIFKKLSLWITFFAFCQSIV